MPQTYSDRIQLVCDYISCHLDEPLPVERLSQVAGFSKFHFHRQFSVTTGISVAKFIQRQRLKRASYQLAFHPEIRIIDVALGASFESPEAFARAFKRAFGQTPTQFREEPQWEPWHQQYQFKSKGTTDIMQVQITEFPTIAVAALEHQGSAESLNNSVAKFIEWRKSTQLSPVKTSQTYGVAYNDPKTTGEDFRFDVCGSVNHPIPENPQGVLNKQIPGGRCAVMRHLGSRDHMDDKIHYLYGEWLPEAGEELRDFPVFFHYLNLFPEVPEHELVTDIYLPLK